MCSRNFILHRGGEGRGGGVELASLHHLPRTGIGRCDLGSPMTNGRRLNTSSPLRRKAAPFHPSLGAFAGNMLQQFPSSRNGKIHLWCSASRRWQRQAAGCSASTAPKKGGGETHAAPEIVSSCTEMARPSRTYPLQRPHKYAPIRTEVATIDKRLCDHKCTQTNICFFFFCQLSMR